MTARTLTDTAVIDMSDNPVTDDQAADIVDNASREDLQPLIENFFDIALKSEDPGAVASALRVLGPYLSRDPGLGAAVDTRMLALIDQGLAAGTPALAEAIAKSVYDRSRERVNVAIPFIPALLSFLDMDMATIGAPSYYTLMIVAAGAPDDLGPFVGTLIGKLAGPGIAASTFAARIITVLARNRPEYVTDARDALRHLCETCTEGILKTEAAKAYQAIGGSLLPDGDSEGCERDETAIVRPHEATANPAPITLSDVQSAGAPSGPSVDNTRLLSIIARLFRIRGEARAAEAGDEALDEIAGDMSAFVQWVESKFTLTEGSLNLKRAAISPEEIDAIARRNAPADASKLAAAPGRVTTQVLPVVETPLPQPEVPGLPAAAETQPLETEATTKVSDNLSDSSFNAAEIAAMRDLMAEFEDNFSVVAGSLLEDMGMGHLRSGRVGEDHKISAKEFVSAFDKLINENRIETKAHLSDAPASGFDAKSLVSELKRCISLSQSTSVLVPAPDVPANPVPPVEKKAVPETVSLSALEQSPKPRKYYTRSGTKMCVKIEPGNDKK
ncbi:MAG: hypothetical protein A4E28_00045 [Methanocella sp. PtaU1.Bin125]|nr:MAG: hypothetical protein A4E28_00045 [Methanocella sp. PtaU1.Bin125]